MSTAERQPTPAEPENTTGPNAADVENMSAEIEGLRHRLRNERIRHCEELRQFAYAVSHDLREPLRMVRSYTQLIELRHEERSDAERREYLGYINEAVERTERLLGALVTYSLLLKPLDQPDSLVDAEAVLGAVLLTLDNSIRESNAQITHDPLPTVSFDFDHLSQLFRELIGNALKFRATEAPRIHVSASPSEAGITFSVRDNGIGIDPRSRDQIFGVFKRLHGREYPGTGMGLAICKRIVDQHDGTIWVESDGSDGSTFRFTLRT